MLLRSMILALVLVPITLSPIAAEPARVVPDPTDLGVPYRRYTTTDLLSRTIAFYLSMALAEKPEARLPVVLWIQIVAGRPNSLVWPSWPLAPGLTAELLRSTARVYLAHGTNDAATPVTAFDLARAELAVRNRDVTTERLQGADHGFRTESMLKGAHHHQVVAYDCSLATPPSTRAFPSASSFSRCATSIRAARRASASGVSE